MCITNLPSYYHVTFGVSKSFLDICVDRWKTNQINGNHQQPIETKQAKAVP